MSSSKPDANAAAPTTINAERGCRRGSFETAQVWRFEDGLATSFREYHDRQDAINAGYGQGADNRFAVTGGTAACQHWRGEAHVVDRVALREADSDMGLVDA